MMSEQTPQPDSSTPSARPTSASRRRLLRAGVGASPAILTFVSAPVRATYSVKTASAFGSMTTGVSHTHSTVPSSGCKPGWWAKDSNWSAWPASCKTSSGGPKLFRDVFSDYGSYGAKTLKECLKLASDTGMDGVVKHCCAAYLNAASGKVPATLCSTFAAKDIWTSYTTRGHYVPTAGVKWFSDSCVPAGTGGINPWLRSTMPYG